MINPLSVYRLPNTTPFRAVNAIRVGGTYEICTEGDKNLYWAAVGNCVVFTVRTNQNITPQLIIRYYSEAGAKFGLDISAVAQPNINAPMTGPKQSWADLTVPIPALGATGLVEVTWDVLPGANSYNLYRSTSAGTELLIKSGILTNSYFDTGLVIGTQYFYRATANGAAGEGPFSNESSAIATGDGIHQFKVYAATPGLGIQSIRFQ